MRLPWPSIPVLLLLGGLVARQCGATEPQVSGASAAPDPSIVEFFEKEVRPVFVGRCQQCHGASKQKGGLRLDSRTSVLAGGNTGPAVVPGRPNESLLVDAINYGELYQMPPKSKLPAHEIASLTRWVEMGAPWPDQRAPQAAAGTRAPRFDLAQRARHWSFQPLRAARPPAVRRRDWPRSPVDRFILAKLEARGLAPAPEADRRTLIRRVTYDLIGLPPTPAEIDAFLADPRADAYERLVDRLLASPHYGERWARHWLDLVRFAETAGHEFDFDTLGASRYRDYVIRAFKDDVPYDRLVVEHLAGDLLPRPRRHPTTGCNESILGTGSFFLGEGTHSPVDLRDDEAQHVDNQLDVLSKTFLGLTVACARCHDHKFDPISTKDYYALAGYLHSSRHQQAFIDPPDRIEAQVAELRSLMGILRDRLGDRLRSPRVDAEIAPRRDSANDGSVLFEGFDGPDFGGWSATGPAFGSGPTRGGELALRDDGPAPCAVRCRPGQVHSGLVSERLQGVLRSPTFVIEKKFIHYLAGGRRGRINLVVDHFEKIRNPIYGGLTFVVDAGDRPRWYAQDVSLWVGHRAYIELADGATADYSQGATRSADGSGFLAVDEIRFSDRPTTPDDQQRPRPDVLDLTSDADSLGGLLCRYREVEEQIPPPTLAPAIADGTGMDEAVSLRGNPRTPGEVVPRRFLEVISGVDQPPPARGSGRLELAARLIDPSNPLPARVMVNRIWKHHFGEGIVRTPDDFGAMGRAPSHPELLDFLATRFIEQGWSIKDVQRMLVLSSTYRMQSRPEAEAERLDPANELWHRMNVRRLEAEAIRDAILAVSGRLNPTLYGPSVLPFLTPFMDGRGRPNRSGPLDGDGRRSLYISVRRNFLTPMFLAFDYPTPSSTMGRRNVSNVPAQALTLLNDPFVNAQARLWAEHLLAGTRGEPPLARLDRLYVAAFGRPPTPEETAEGLSFLAEQASTYGREDDPRAWADLCHVLLNVKEFIFIN